MMKILSTKNYPIVEIIRLITCRQSKKKNTEASVKRIIKEVCQNKDAALFALAKKFDNCSLKKLLVSRKEIQEAYKRENKEFIWAFKKAKRNIERFHTANLGGKEAVVKIQAGVKVWREFRPIEKIGLYVPGGKAVYPSTVLMLAIPARIAGCKEIILCSPPNRDGKINSSVLVAADICGISKIFKIGGAQAIAAMAYGTQSIPKVSKIVGPGNQYVTTTKMLVYGQVDIDMPAGPSEVLVFADETANASWVAADLLSQLEHGEDSQAILVTLSGDFAKLVREELFEQARRLSRTQIIRKSLKNSFIVVAKDIDESCDLIND
jgi:histidinol dehydrogenase